MNTPTPPPAAGGDPSMEDILASIRRILNEEEAPAAGALPTPPEAPIEEDVLVLDPTMRVDTPPLAGPAEPPAQPSPAASAQSAIDDIFADAPAPAPAVATPIAPTPAIPTPPITAAVEPAAPSFPASALDPAMLLAPEAAAAAAASMDSLVRGITAERSTLVHAGGPTIEDLVRAELRPLLKSWLDTHLPPMVERLVRAEMERVSARAVP